MARASRKQPAKQKAAPKKAARQRPTDWTNVKVDWPQAKQAISLRIDQDILAGSATAAPAIRPG